ncbi:MAG: DUF4093 domain-containing protein [Lentisphaerae bacterium]|nr:DUF4093 domain-containing protein [Lentisphaerota bacterium]NLV50919.1 DUF4093 domain-containing protein [Clostridiales bacterium]
MGINKTTVNEAIIVEGRYDRNTLSQFLDAFIIETRGFGIFTDDELMLLISRLAQSRGIVILTDSDGAGFMIRNKIKSCIRDGKVLHAYIPDITGREKRKNRSSKEGKLGVEAMEREVLLNALRNSGATMSDSFTKAEKSSLITKADLYLAGLSGREGSALRRKSLAERMKLPGLLSSTAMLDILNALYSRDEFLLVASDILDNG